MISVRRSTVMWIALAAVVLAAFGIGTAIGLTVGSSSPPATKADRAVTTTTARASSSTTTTTPLVPVVLSCGPKSTPHVRPAKLTVDCAKGDVTVTDITWNDWDTSSGGQGTGTLNEPLASTPAVVVVFDEVHGIFQYLSITPTADVSTAAPTTGTATTTTTGGPSPIVAQNPGSGWGAD